MKYTKKVISLMLILVLMLSIVPFGATESTEDPAAIEDVSDPSPLENPAPMEQQAPEEQPPAEQTPTLTEAPTPVETESPTEQPTITEQPTPPEEPTTAPTPEEPTQEPLPSPTVQAEIDDKAGWEHAPQYIDYSSYEIGLGNSFEVFLTDFYGGTGRYTYSYYIYNNNNVVVQKTGYTINSRYTYTPKALGKYYAVVYIKNDNGDIRTIKSDKRRVDVIEKLIPLYVQANVLTNNIVLGDAKHFKIESNGGNGSTPHLHTYYVYKNNKIIEKFSYKQSVKDGHYFSTEVVYTPKSPGKYMFSVFAKDAAGRTTLAYTDAFLVTGAALNLRASVNKIEKINEIATVVAEANGGSGTYQYAYYVYKDNAIIQKVWYTANAKFYYIPKSEGRYKVQVFVRDSLGAVKTEFTQEFYVTSPCLSADIRYIRKGADCFYCKTYAKGGVPPYKYAHYIYENEVLVEKLPYADGVVDIDSIDLYNDPDNYGYYYELKYTPKNPGFYKVIAFVKDATGKIKTSTTGSIDYVKNWLENVAPPQIESSIGLGNSINVKTYLRHGTGIYKYAYYIYKDGKILQKFPYTSNPTLVYRPTSIGTYQVKVFVKDDLSSGHSMSNTCIVKPLEPLEF
ncbi:MAG: hypothetical protein GYA87_04695, partial [Christensenellaceae bacterium]|nr:hypothetical protein [Christensenellaceae bacterium]